MVARNRARYLAPIALAATITATYFVAHAALSSNHSSTSSHLAHRAQRRGAGAVPASYVVQQGDSLSSISAKTGVPLPTIEALNPSVDPNALQTGQRLRLRR